MKEWNVRTILRTVVAMVCATLFTLKASVGDGLTSEEWVDLAIAFFGTAALWLGIGVIPGKYSTEPFLNKPENTTIDVPSPPADVVPDA